MPVHKEESNNLCVSCKILEWHQIHIQLDVYPDTYKTFIRSGDDSHTALATPLLYTAEANGVPLHEWTDDFRIPRNQFWVDIVEDFVPVP